MNIHLIFLSSLVLLSNAIVYPYLRWISDGWIWYDKPKPWIFPDQNKQQSNYINTIYQNPNYIPPQVPNYNYISPQAPNYNYISPQAPNYNIIPENSLPQTSNNYYIKPTTVKNCDNYSTTPVASITTPTPPLQTTIIPEVVTCDCGLANNIIIGNNRIEEDTTTENYIDDTTPMRVDENSETDRVVNGIPAIKHQYPWLVLIILQQNLIAPPLPWCGGAIISSLFILTAAHCIIAIEITQIKVVVGLHDRCISESTTSEISVISKHIPNDYEPKLLANDIALLKLSMPLTFGLTIKPICMPRPGIMYWGKVGEVAGWGKTNYSTTNVGSCILLKAFLPVLSRALCSESKYKIKQITKSHFCAGSVEEQTADTCQGDSGGPLMISKNDDDRYELVGVVSGGQGCALSGYPGLYTKVVDFLPWIEQHTKEAPFCIKY